MGNGGRRQDDVAAAREVADILRSVVCPKGLDAGALVQVEDQLAPLIELDCVRSRLRGSDGPLATTVAVVGAVTDVLASWPPGPAREATERLLGVGPTRTLPRRQRRGAARQVLGVGEEHFRKHREGILLGELATAMLIASAPAASRGHHDSGGHDLASRGADPVGDQEPGDHANKQRGEAHSPSPGEPQDAGVGGPATPAPGARPAWLRPRIVWVATAVVLVAAGAGAALGELAGGRSPSSAVHTGSVVHLGSRPPPQASGPLIPGDNSQFVRENDPNGVRLAAHSHARKTWWLANAGTATWRGRWLERESSSGPCRTPERVPVPTTRPGQQVAVTVPVATEGPGVCRATWKMTTRGGVEFFPNKPVGVNFVSRIR